MWCVEGDSPSWRCVGYPWPHSQLPMTRLMHPPRYSLVTSRRHSCEHVALTSGALLLYPFPACPHALPERLVGRLSVPGVMENRPRLAIGDVVRLRPPIAGLEDSIQGNKKKQQSGGAAAGSWARADGAEHGQADHPAFELQVEIRCRGRGGLCLMSGSGT